MRFDHLNVRSEHDPSKDKGRNGSYRATPNRKTLNLNSTAPDALNGWFDLAKPSRNSQQKRTWQKGAQK